MWFLGKRNEFTAEQLYRERGWDEGDIMMRIAENKMDFRDTGDGRCIYIESERETRKYRAGGSAGATETKPLTKEIVLFEKPGYGRITRTVPIVQPKPEPETNAVWEVIKLVCFLIMLPFTILGMRDGAQWFLGTGEYGGGGGDGLD